MQIRTRTWVLIVWLQSLGAVRGQDCTLQDFLEGPLFDPNFDTSDLQSSYAPGRQVRVGCSAGYSGFFKLICVEGRWQSRGVKCKSLSCELPPGGGSVTVKGLPDGEEGVLPDHLLLFSCDAPGKRLNGSAVLVCGSDGQWDHPFPSCQDTTCEVGELHPQLRVRGFDPAHTNMEVGHKLYFQCNNAEYFLDGATEVTCLQTGMWSSTFPTCGPPRNCLKAPPLSGGDIILSTKFWYQHGEQVEYVCQRYYLMEGGPFKTCRNGEWIGEIRCLRPCTVDRDIMNQHHITIRHSRDDKIYSEPNDVIEFTCIRGTRPTSNTPMRQTCIDGQITLPSCE